MAGSADPVHCRIGDYLAGNPLLLLLAETKPALLAPCRDPNIGGAAALTDDRQRFVGNTEVIGPSLHRLRLGAVRRLASEEADCGLLSADLAAGMSESGEESGQTTMWGFPESWLRPGSHELVRVCRGPRGVESRNRFKLGVASNEE